MARNTPLNSRSKQAKSKASMLSVPTPTHSNHARSARELKRAERRTKLEIEKMEMVLAAGQSFDHFDSARLPHYRQQLERRRSASLFMRVAVLGLVILAALGWMNQRFHFWN